MVNHFPVTYYSFQVRLQKIGHSEETHASIHVGWKCFVIEALLWLLFTFLFVQEDGNRNSIVFPTMWMCVKLLQSCPTLWPHRLQPPGSSVHEILQARTLEWVSVPSSGDLPDPEIEPASLLSPALADRFFTTSATWEAPTMWINNAKKWSDTQMQETFITCVFHSKFNSEDANQASLDNL